MKIVQKLLKRKGPVLILVLRIFYRLRLIEASFYTRAFIWHLKHRKIKHMTIEDVYYFFYVSFLRIPPDRIEIIKKTESSITTGCTNDCPVLNIATIIGEDTRNACVRISKGPCNYFIRKLGTNIHYENDYRQIRPHYPKCIETVYFTTDTSIQ